MSLDLTDDKSNIGSGNGLVPVNKKLNIISILLQQTWWSTRKPYAYSMGPTGCVIFLWWQFIGHVISANEWYGVCIMFSVRAHVSYL